MAGGLWLVVAKQEIRILSSRFRAWRKLVFSIVVIVLVAWSIAWNVIMPALHGAPPDPVQEHMIGTFLAPVIELILFVLFLYFFIIPISATIQESETKQFDLVIASPVRPGDLFIGQFIGKQPVYVIIALVLAPLVGFGISQFSHSMRVNVIAQVFLTFSIILVLLLATLLGTILAFWISKKVNNIKGAKDKARALLVAFSVFIMILFYGMGELGRAMITDPGLRAAFQFIPSTWIANVINALAFPSMSPVAGWFGPVPSLLAFAALTVVVFTLSHARAGAFFSFEGSSIDTGTLSRAKGRWIGYFSKFSRKEHAGVITFLAREFFRKMENLAKLGFCIGMVIVIVVFLPSGRDDLDAPVMDLSLLSWMFSMMAGLLLGSYILINGKDMLFLYKKSPFGMSRFVHSSVHFHFLVAVPLILVVAIVGGCISAFHPSWVILLVISLVLSTFSSITLSTAIQCFRPAFQERSPTMTINVFLYTVIMIASYFAFMAFVLAALPGDMIVGSDPLFLVSILGLGYPVIMVVATRILLRFAIARLYRTE